MTRAHLALVPFVLLAACGGSSASKPPATDPAPAPSATQAATPKVDHRAEFLTACTKTPDFAGYCECGWTEFSATFSEEEMEGKKGPLAKDKVTAFKAKTQKVCSEKFPEEGVHKAYLKRCTADSTPLTKFCECAYTEYRKTFTAMELVDDAAVSSDRGVQARKGIGKTCGKDAAEKDVREAWITPCTNESKSKPFCECAWKELRKVASPVQVALDDYDSASVIPKITETCGKHMDKAAK
jgi:hypothetical protein